MLDFRNLKQNLGEVEMSVLFMQDAKWINQEERVQLMYAVSKLYVFLEDMQKKNKQERLLDISKLIEENNKN